MRARFCFLGLVLILACDTPNFLANLDSTSQASCTKHLRGEGSHTKSLGIDIYTVNQLHIALDRLCRDPRLPRTFQAGYRGPLGMPRGRAGIQPSDSDHTFLSWDILQPFVPDGTTALDLRVIFRIVASAKKSDKAVTSVMVNGQRLYLEVHDSSLPDVESRVESLGGLSVRQLLGTLAPNGT